MRFDGVYFVALPLFYQGTASQSMQSQIQNQVQQLQLLMVSSQSQARLQISSQNLHNDIALNGAPNSSGLSSGLPAMSGTMPNIPGPNANIQNMQSLPNMASNAIGNSMGQGMPAGNYANPQRQVQNRQQPDANQEQAQHSQGSHQYVYNQQIMEEESALEVTNEQKIEFEKWFFLNSPAGEISYVAKDVRELLRDEKLFEAAAAEAFPIYNKAHMICLEFPDRTGEVLITSYNEIVENEYLDPRTTQVAIVNHVKQVCESTRVATDEELSSSYVEEYRGGLDAEIIKYVVEAYPKGVSCVYCTSEKEGDEGGSEFELVVVISSIKNSPQNFCNGSWLSTWVIKFNDDLQIIELTGKLMVEAHYFEEGNVQLDTKKMCKDSTILQSPNDSAVSLTNIIRHHETEYLNYLQVSYSKLPDTTFKDLRRKLPVTRTLFPWHNTLQFSLSKDIKKNLGLDYSDSK